MKKKKKSMEFDYREIINFTPWKKNDGEKNWCKTDFRISLYCFSIFRKRREGVVRKGASSDKRLGRGKWRRKGRQNDASCFATAWRERGTSANPSFASVYGALSISPNWYLVVAITKTVFQLWIYSSLVTRFLWRMVARRKRKRASFVCF